MKTNQKGNELERKARTNDRQKRQVMYLNTFAFLCRNCGSHDSGRIHRNIGDLMGVQKIGGAQLHIEAARNGNTVQVWMHDNQNLTYTMFSRKQAFDLARMLARSFDHEPIDE